MPSFTDLFGFQPAVRASAPGRVNLIGEHTDYNGGFVFPVAIPQRTHVELSPIPGDEADVWSADIGPAGDRRRFAPGGEAPQRGWIDYVQGVTRALGADGHRIGAFAARIESSIPLGSGLSSSAALEVSLLRALRSAFDLAIDDIGIARLGQRAETEFVGAPIGIMDQMASALGDTAHALFLDTRSLSYERVPIPAGIELVVIDSGIAHNHAAGGYRTRREECDRAAALLGVPQLRDVGPAELARIDDLPAVLARRARHVVTENARVLELVGTLRANDPAAAGRLLLRAHASLRDDFEVSLPDIDRLVAVAAAQPGIYGARLTGGGFGGAIVALAERGRGAQLAAAIASEYEQQTGRWGRVLIP